MAIINMIMKAAPFKNNYNKTKKLRHQSHTSIVLIYNIHT